MRRLAAACVTLAAAATFLAPPAAAKPAYVKKAQDAGHKALVTNCASCHKAKLPTKKDFTMNDTLGTWIEKKMKASGAKDMDTAWLKDYKPAAAK